MKKTIYCMGQDVRLDGSEACLDYLAVHATTEYYAMHAPEALVLHFEDDQMQKINLAGRGRIDRRARKLEAEEKGMPLPPEMETRHYFSGNFGPKGRSQLGGYKPDDFVLPAMGPVSFQYLGFISHRDSGTAFLPETVHLTFPIYSNVAKVWLDYSDGNAPKVLNQQEVEDADTSYGNYIGPDTHIVYYPTRFSLDRERPNPYGGAKGGIPQWKQSPFIPHCPKTGRRMQFLAQFSSQQTRPTCHILEHNIPLQGSLREERIGRNGDIDVYCMVNPAETHYHNLHFWGDGDLYIFFEPEAKTACLFIQNT